MSLLPGQIDSFGSCKNNADAEDVLESLGHLEDAGPHASRWNIKVYDAIHSLVANRADFGSLFFRKITTINYYKFTIAFENSNDLGKYNRGSLARYVLITNVHRLCD